MFAYLGRPTYSRRTYILPGYFVPSELAERNSTKIGHMVGSQCNLKTHVQNLVYPFSLQIGGPITTFLHNFSGNFNDLYLPNETRCRQLGKCVDNCGVFYIVSKWHELWSTNCFILDVIFNPL